MTEYIEREKVINLLKKYGIKRGNKVYGIADIGDITTSVEDIPAADVVSRSAFDQIIDRLSKYEATGMTPEEIMSASNRRHNCKIDCLLKEYNALKEKLDKVVRCRDCKSYNKPRLGWCSFHMDRENQDDFCSYGERKAE